MNIYLEIREYKTDKVVKRYDVTNSSSRMIDKFEDGLNINLNHDKFYTIKNETKLKFNT